MKQRTFDDIVRKKMDQYEAAVPTDAWHNIVQRKKKKRRVIFFWWIPAILALTGIGVLSFFLLGEKNDSPPIANQQGVAVAATDNSPSIEKPDSKKTAVDEDGFPTVKEKTNAISDTTRYRILSTSQNPVNTPGRTNSATAIAANNNRTPNKKRTITGVVLKDQPPAMVSSKKKIKNNRQKNSTASTRDITLQNTPVSLLADRQPPAITNSYDSSVVAAKSKNEIIDSTEKENSHPYVLPVVDSDSAIAIKKETGKKLRKHGGWSIEASLIPFFTIADRFGVSSLTRVTNTANNKSEFRADQVKTTIPINQAIQLAVHKRLSARWTIGTGLQYSRIVEEVTLAGTEINTQYISVKRLASDNTGSYLINDTFTVTTSGVRTIDAVNNYQQLSLPLMAQYSIFRNKKFQVQLTGGTYIHLSRKYQNSIRGEIKTIYMDSLQHSTRTSSIGLDVFAGMRVSTMIGKRYWLFAEPSFRYGVIKNNTANMVNAGYLHQAGIMMGVSYQLAGNKRK